MIYTANAKDFQPKYRNTMFQVLEVSDKLTKFWMILSYEVKNSHMRWKKEGA